jgi:hypothetical protein
MTAPSSVPAGGGLSAVSNTDIVLVLLADLGGGERAIDIEDVAEAAWRAVPARFSWPRHQQYPDLDSVDVTLRAAKKNDGLVTGAKKTGWMLTLAGSSHVERCEDVVRAYVDRRGKAGRSANRRERGGADSSAVRRLTGLRASEAVAKHRRGALDQATVHDFLAFYEVNQYMPEVKYQTNRQRVMNLVRDDAELSEVADRLHERFGTSYKTQLLRLESDRV